MSSDRERFERLSLSFHQSFVPERRYLSALMRFAAELRDVGLEEVAESTGIPTGESSGKVEPTILYAKGMGLIEVSRGQVGRWNLRLSPLGGTILAEDPFLSEGFTQWILHLLLCRRRGGADAWHTVFAEGRLALGKVFDEAALKAFLVARYGKRSNAVGPLLRMYATEASFSACGALGGEGKRLEYRPAPDDATFFPGYRYLFLTGWDACFDGIQQVALEDFERQTHLFTVMGWDAGQVNRFVDRLADDRLVRVDRQTGGAMVLRACGSDGLLEEIYGKLL